MINFWATVATNQVNACAWKNMTLTGIQLYTAHEITMAAQNTKAALKKGVPGVTGGIATNKTVGGVSVQYDPQTTTEKEAGYWNQTTYGKQFIRLARLFGAGALQLNGRGFYGPGLGNAWWNS
jgi:hypothetical protein